MIDVRRKRRISKKTWIKTIRNNLLLCGLTEDIAFVENISEDILGFTSERMLW